MLHCRSDVTLQTGIYMLRCIGLIFFHITLQARFNMLGSWMDSFMLQVGQMLHRAFRCRFDFTCYVLGQILVYMLRLRLGFQLHVTLQDSSYMLHCRLNITCYVVSQILHVTLQVKLYMLRCRLDFTCYGFPLGPFLFQQ